MNLTEASRLTIDGGANKPGCELQRSRAKETARTWHKVCALDSIPRQGARVVRNETHRIAIFRNADDEVFAVTDRCPHKGGPLSQGIVFGRNVSCPLHGWTIRLDEGRAASPDVGCVERFDVRIEAGAVFLRV